MHLLVLGGTGRCGSLIVREALGFSHTVVIYARAPQKLPQEIREHPSVTIIEGELTNAKLLTDAIEGVDAVLSALGPPVGIVSALTYSSHTPLARAYSTIIAAMKKHGVQRLILLGTTSMKDDNDQFSAKFSTLIGGVAVFAHHAYRDVVAMGDVVRGEGSGLLWTIVRVPILTNERTTEVVAGYVGDGKTTTTLSRIGFAAFVLKELHTNEWCRKAPLVTSP